MPKIPELNAVTELSATSYVVGVKDGKAVRFLATVFSSTHWYSGGTAPDVSTGTENDCYLDTETGDIYQKRNGAWNLLLNIKGMDGVDGEDGTDGVGIPAGGASGQALIKQSAADFDVAWGTPQAEGVSLGKVIALS